MGLTIEDKRETDKELHVSGVKSGTLFIASVDRGPRQVFLKISEYAFPLGTKDAVYMGGAVVEGFQPVNGVLQILDNIA